MFMLLMIVPFNSGLKGLVYLIPIMASAYLLYSVIFLDYKGNSTGVSILCLVFLTMFIVVFEISNQNGLQGFNWTHLLFMVTAIFTMF